jgi:hypothetical protein
LRRGDLIGAFDLAPVKYAQSAPEGEKPDQPSLSRPNDPSRQNQAPNRLSDIIDLLPRRNAVVDQCGRSRNADHGGNDAVATMQLVGNGRFDLGTASLSATAVESGMPAYSHRKSTVRL